MFSIPIIIFCLDRRPETLKSLPSTCLVLFISAAVLLCLGQFRMLSVDRRWETEKGSLTNLHLRLDELGYHASVPGVGSGVAEWAAMQNWREGPTVFTVQSGFATRVIPKSVLTNLEQDDLRQMLIAKIGPAGVERSL